jgi:dihydroorotase
VSYEEPVDLLITGSRLLTAKGLVRSSVAIDGTKVVKIGKDASMPRASEYLKLPSSSLLLPGVVDVHSHLRDMDLKHKGDFASETQAAAAGGITFAVDMPNSRPPTLSAEAFEEKKRIASGRVAVDFGLNLGVYGNEDELSKVEENIAYGEIFVGPSTEGQTVGYPELSRALRIIARTGKPACIHAEDPELLLEVSEPYDHGASRPPEAEHRAVSRVLSLNESIGARLHFCHISTSRALSTIAQYKNRGMDVTCEVTPHHLILGEDVTRDLGPLAKMNPPLRGAADVGSMLEGTRSETIDIIASDHAPHTLDEKSSGLGKAPSGVPGFETFIPSVLTYMMENSIDPVAFVRLANQGPARIFSIPQKGFGVGRDADLVVLDTKRRVVDPDSFLSKARYSPFQGRKLKFWPVKTLLRGEIIFEDGDIIIKDRGHFICSGNQDGR